MRLVQAKYSIDPTNAALKVFDNTKLRCSLTQWLWSLYKVDPAISGNPLHKAQS